MGAVESKSNLPNAAEYNTALFETLLFPDMRRYVAELKVDPTRAPDVWRALKVRGDSVYWRREFKKALRVYSCIVWMKERLFPGEVVKTRDQSLFDVVMCYIALGDSTSCLEVQLVWEVSHDNDPKFLSDSAVFNAIQRSDMTVEQRREFLRGVQIHGYCLEETEQDIVENDWSRKYASEKALFTSKMEKAKHLFTLRKFRQASELYSEVFHKMNLVFPEDLLAKVLYNRASTYIALGFYHHDKARDDLRDILILLPGHEKVIEKYTLLKTGQGEYVDCDIVDINSDFFVSRRHMIETPFQKYAQVLSGKEEYTDWSVDMYKYCSSESIILISLVEAHPDQAMSLLEQFLENANLFLSKRLFYDALYELRKATYVARFCNDRNLWSTPEKRSKTEVMINVGYICCVVALGQLTMIDIRHQALKLNSIRDDAIIAFLRHGLLSDNMKKMTLTFLQERGYCLKFTEADFYPNHPDDKPDRLPYYPMTDEQVKSFTDWIVGWFAPSSTESQTDANSMK